MYLQSDHFPSLHVADCRPQWFTHIPNLIYAESQNSETGQYNRRNMKWMLNEYNIVETKKKGSQP